MSAQDSHPVLPYATPDAQGTIPFIRAMRAWRHVAGWGFWLTLGGLFLYLPLALVAFGMLVVASIGAIVCMFRAAASEVGTGYAIRHLCLAMLLLPIAFMGVFIVTRMVEADLINWRLAARPPA